MARYFHHRIPPESNSNVTYQKVLLKRILQQCLDSLANPQEEDLTEAIKDVSMALSGKNVEFIESEPLVYPNGIRVGQGGLNNEELYEDLPVMMTSEEYDDLGIPNF